MSDQSRQLESPAPMRESADSAQRDRQIWFEQYKLAVEMAARLSSRRQDVNKFYIALISTLGVLYKLLDKLSPPSDKWSFLVLPLLGVCWCFLWWLTIRSHRRIDKAKWTVIYHLETKLPFEPFFLEELEIGLLATGKKSYKRKKVLKQEDELLAKFDLPRRPDPGFGSFALTKLELFIPGAVGVGFLVLAWVSRR